MAIQTDTIRLVKYKFDNIDEKAVIVEDRTFRGFVNRSIMDIRKKYAKLGGEYNSSNLKSEAFIYQYLPEINTEDYRIFLDGNRYIIQVAELIKVFFPTTILACFEDNTEINLE